MEVPLRILALLATEGPRHGYDLRRAHDALFGRSKPLRFGHLYATLQRLVRDGLAEEAGEERGNGPDRRRYAITPAGRAQIEAWLDAPEEPAASLESDLHAKVVFALRAGRPVAELIERQRALHLARMRELTRLRDEAPLVDAVLADHVIYRLDADLRWLDHTQARLDQLRAEVAP